MRGYVEALEARAKWGDASLSEAELALATPRAREQVLVDMEIDLEEEG